MDPNQNTSIHYHYATPTGELVGTLEPSGVQPVVTVPGITDNQAIIYTTGDGDGQLQVYHQDGSPALQGLEGQDTIVFLEEGMEVETETEVATASEAVEAVKYIEEGGDQMQKIIIQMAPHDQEIRQEPQHIIIPGLENYTIQTNQQSHQPGNVRHYQHIQPKTIYPKIAMKPTVSTDKPTRSLPLILKPPQIAQQTLTQPVKSEATIGNRSEITLPAKVVIDSKQVKSHKKYPAAQNENTEYIYVTRVLATPKDDSKNVGKSVYNTVKVSRPQINQVDAKTMQEATFTVTTNVEESPPQPVASHEENKDTAPALTQVVPPLSKKVASTPQQLTGSTQQVVSLLKPVASTSQQVETLSKPATLSQVASAPQQVASTSQQIEATSQQEEAIPKTATLSQVAASPHSVAATPQQVAPTVSAETLGTASRATVQQSESSINPKRPKMVSLLGTSRNIIKKDGSVFPVDPVSRKVIFVPLSADEAEKAVSMEESSNDVNSDDDVEDEELEPLTKKAKPSYETLERETSGKRKGKWKKKPNGKKSKPKWTFYPTDVAPTPKQPAKSKKREKAKGIKTSKGKSNSEDTVNFDPNIQIKQEVMEEDTTSQKQKKKNDDESEEELEDMTCRLCLSLHNTECPLLRRRVKTCISDNDGCLNSSMLSLKTLPKEFVLSSRDGHGLSVFASDIIEKGTQFGPLVGEQMTFEEISHKMDFRHLWLIETEETMQEKDKKKIKYNFVDTGNEMTSNWCRYLRPSLNSQECNLICYCKNKEILFVAREDIQEGEELIMYFRFIEDLYKELWFADLFNRTEKLCKRCDVVYTNLVSYVKHVQVFHPYSLKKLKAICKECGLVLESTGELTQHCKEAHQGNGAFVCKDCGKQFPIPRGLQQHRKFFHIVEGNFPCEHCGKCFFNKFKLRNHMRNKHSGKEFKCETCSKVVGSQNALNRHRRSHTRDGYKFTCDRCGKSCRDNSNLRSHMITHIKTRRFPCTVAGCTMRYGSKVALQMHFAKTHFLSPEQIKVHMLSITKLEKEEIDELVKRKNTRGVVCGTQTEILEEEEAGVMSGTQTDIVYELESEDEDDYTEYY